MIPFFTYTEDFTPCGAGILSTGGIELYAVAGGLLIRRRGHTLSVGGVIFHPARNHPLASPKLGTPPRLRGRLHSKCARYFLTERDHLPAQPKQWTSLTRAGDVFSPAHGIFSPCAIGHRFRMRGDFYPRLAVCPIAQGSMRQFYEEDSSFVRR